MTDSSFVVRGATPSDSRAVLALEKEVWHPRGAPAMDLTTFKRWIRSYPDGFLICTQAGTVAGYAYVEPVSFTPDAAGVAVWRSRTLQRKWQESHFEPEGNALLGVSIASRRHGAGAVLISAVISLGQRLKLKHLITFSRMPGLGRFMGIACGKGTFSQEEKDEFACAYAAQTVRLVGGTIASVFEPQLEREPLPRLERVDPVLSWFVRHAGMVLYAVVPSAFADPASNDRAALLASSL